MLNKLVITEDKRKVIDNGEEKYEVKQAGKFRDS